MRSSERTSVLAITIVGCSADKVVRTHTLHKRVFTHIHDGGLNLRRLYGTWDNCIDWVWALLTGKEAKGNVLGEERKQIDIVMAVRLLNTVH